MSRAVSRRTSITATLVRAQGSQCGICDGKDGEGTVRVHREHCGCVPTNVTTSKLHTYIQPHSYSGQQDKLLPKLGNIVIGNYVVCCGVHMKHN